MNSIFLHILCQIYKPKLQIQKDLTLMTSAPNNIHSAQNTYQGLINEGSTCYLNSLIQTLFMTAQFRKNIYSYIHNAKKLDLKDSIPYQLQKLFVQLQTSKSKLVTSKGLLKSFQWTEADAFEQHDVQEFCRKLFEAIQISNKKAHWITDLFQGSTVSFVNCGKHKSQKQETFMDISLAIHNPYTHQTFQSLQQCLKQYLKVQKLQDKFHCDQCGEKVEVQKGMRIHSLPRLLTIQLNRFQLNYETWQREKLNNFLYFPQLLYMGKFMKQGQSISISQLPPDLRSKVKIIEQQKSSRTAEYFGHQNIPPTNVPKITPKRKASDQIQSNAPKVFFFDEQTKRQKQQKSLSQEEQKQKSRQILANLKSEKSQIDSKMKSMGQREEKKQLQSIEDDMLFGSGMGFLADNQPLQWNSGTVDKEDDPKKPNYSKNQVLFQHEQEVFNPQKQYPQQTYMLYAVLVHSGGAYGGHYFAYISNGRDWFKFDDSTVRKVNRFEMRKYGNFNKASHGANAYLLFYRDVSTFKQGNPDEIQIPEQLLQKVKNDVEVNKQQQSKVQKRFKQIAEGVLIKVFKITNIEMTNSSIVEPISVLFQNRHQETIRQLKFRVKSLYSQLQDIGQKNWRLRRYNKTQDTLHEVYDDQYDLVTLEALGFRETVHVAVEIKQGAEEFQEYDPRKIIIKVNVWRPDITIVTEKFLKPIKIQISEQSSFKELADKIKHKFKLQSPVIIKRSFSQSNPIFIYSLQQTKKLIELRFFSGINLYVQDSFIDNKSRWVNQFESQKFRCLIKYNNPDVSQNRDQQVYFDTRKTLKQLKAKLSTLIGLQIGQFRIKKTKKSVSQLTAFGKKLCDLKFIANQFVYLQKGKSSCGTVILQEGRVEVLDGRIQFGIYQETVIELEENILTIGDLLSKLSQRLNVPAKLLRIREYKAYQFGQIFRSIQNIQRIKQKSLIWEHIKSEQISEMKGLQLYVRVWDVMQMQLGELKQIYVDSAATFEQFAYVLQQELGIKVNRLLAWKALSNYVQKQILLDCDWIEVCYIRRQIKQQPLYITTDGQILIIKQAEKEYHSRVNYFTVGAKADRKQKNKQAQLKITVMAQNSDEQEEMLKQALSASIQETEEKPICDSEGQNPVISKNE